MSASSTIRKKFTIPLWVAKDRSPRLTYLKSLEKSQFYNLDKLKEIQFKKLKNICTHAFNQCDFYKKRFQKFNISPENIKDECDIKKIPFLTKNDIRTAADELLSFSSKNQYLSKFKTGGSTGVPVVVLKDRQTVEMGAAAGLRSFRWTGWDLGEPWGLIWGNPPIRKSIKAKLKDMFINPEIYLDTMKINEKAMFDFITLWKKRKPTIMRGHSHSIYIFASYCKNNGITDIRPKGIISISMMLIPHERKLIEKVFNCKVTDMYGCEEVGLIACECHYHHGLHINMENVYVEFINKDSNFAQPGEDSTIVVTSLINKSMPLIRYKIGDVGALSSRTCPCGRNLLIMEGVSGRVADFLVRKDGSLVAGVSLVERTVTAFAGIAQMQIIQENIDRITVNLVRDNSFDYITEKKLIEELKKSVGQHNSITINFVDSIKPETSGKYRFSISNVANPYTTALLT